MLDYATSYRTGRPLQELEFAPPAPKLPRIVALGGGTGLGVLLQGLRQLWFPYGSPMGPDRERLTAVVTVADDGGSSGSLRRAFRVLAPGDIRNCMLALSDADPALQALFNYRFEGGIGGHSLGNLMLTALTLLEKDFAKAVELANRLLKVRGRVLPATAEEVELMAEFADGSYAMGESCITGMGRAIRRVSLVPSGVRALPEALAAVGDTDLVVIGPGSLYTSLLPTLLTGGMADAIVESRAKVVLVMNLMSEPGETDGYCAADVLDALHSHVPQIPIDRVLLNAAPIPKEQLRRYSADGSTPITAAPGSLRAEGCRAVYRNLLGEGPMIRHDPGKLAQALLDIAIEEPL